MQALHTTMIVNRNTIHGTRDFRAARCRRAVCLRWSDQSGKRFGFRPHVCSSEPLPNSEYAVNDDSVDAFFCL